VEQFGTPAEILANPASDFVARFVGTDRGLKRLSLFRVGELPLARAVTAHVGERHHRLTDQAPAGDYLLLLDEIERPVGWVRVSDVPEGAQLEVDLADPTSPVFDARTTLKDALALLLDADVQAGVVVDERGTYQGLVTLSQIAASARDAHETSR